MSEIQCSLHYCSLQYRLVKWIFIIDRDMLLWWINRTVSWVLCLILIILIWCHSHHKRQRWKNVTFCLCCQTDVFFFFTWLFKEQWDQRLKLNYSQELELVCVLHLLIEKSQIKSIKELLKPLNDTTRIIQSYIYLYIDLYDVFSFSYMLNIL